MYTTPRIAQAMFIMAFVGVVRGLWGSPVKARTAPSERNMHILNSHKIEKCECKFGQNRFRNTFGSVSLRVASLARHENLHQRRINFDTNRKCKCKFWGDSCRK